VHQLNLILGILGTPSEEEIRRIGSPRVRLHSDMVDCRRKIMCVVCRACPKSRTPSSTPTPLPSVRYFVFIGIDLCSVGLVGTFVDV
jgi:hypothetical protein